MTSQRPMIYLLAELVRSAGCQRRKVERAFLQDCPQEADFIGIVMDEFYGSEQGAGCARQDGDNERDQHENR